MQIAATLAQQVVVMFVLMGIGFLLRRKEILGKQAAEDLGKLLVKLVLPAVIVQSFWSAAGDGRERDLLYASAASALLLLLAMAVAHLMYPRRPVADFSTAFSNAGFIGIPLTRAVLGSEAVLCIAPFIALLNVLQWTYGQRLLSGEHGRIDIRSIMLSPMLVAMGLGLVLYCVSAPLPQLLDMILGDVSALNSPLAMIVLGCYLAKSDVLSLLVTKSLYVVAVVRLLVIPLLSIAILLLLPGGAELKLSLLLAAAAPVGTNVAVFAQQNGSDYVYACGCVCLSTLLSLITMPLTMAIASLTIG